MSRRSKQRPYFYRKNLINHAQKRYKKIGMTDRELNDRIFEATDEELSECIYEALKNSFSVSDKDINYIKNAKKYAKNAYEDDVKAAGVVRAREKLREQTKFMLKECFSLPIEKIPKKSRELDQLQIMRDSADLTAMLFAKAIPQVLDCDSDRLNTIFETAKDAYRSRNFTENK